ncbi:uncharacterized protein FA14DRAFT_158503 [Meira miltonrushii]|uniref:Uncharacterized protein n=1 Tax=Meira miltonrushii TaxID=1280837 RepID=A0A316V2K5_9BASI|nr:uncharacterized protein FA14DRAFT_158503 [Meira miltonrushii]PWN31692.1 hypothetical protein FA14DRAFT_158503 [Meira miltonrushii]
MKFFAIIFLLICTCSSIQCASTTGLQHTKGTLEYHTWKLASAQQNFERATGEHRAAKAKPVQPGHEEAHSHEVMSKKTVTQLYRGKIKKNQNNVNDLERNLKLPGPKTTKYIVDKDNARAERAQARENPSPTKNRPSSSSKTAEKQMTKGNYQYHYTKFKANDGKRKSILAEHAEMKKKGVPSGMDAEQHQNSLFQKQKMATYHEKEGNKNLSSMYDLENNLKVPGPKDLKYIEVKEQAKNPELARKKYNEIY